VGEGVGVRTVPASSRRTNKLNDTTGVHTFEMATENSLVLVQAMLSLSVEDERKDQRLMAQLAIVERAMETRRAAAALLREVTGSNENSNVCSTCAM